MPIYKFEAMDATGEEIRDVIEAPSEEEAQATIRQMGYFVTMIREKAKDEFLLVPSSKNSKPFSFSLPDFNEVSRIVLKCIVAFMCATLLFELAKTGSFNHNLFIEALLLAIYNKLIK